MRFRLNMLLSLLMASVVLVLGIPVSRSVAQARSRIVCQDRAADLARLADSPGTTAAQDDRTASRALTGDLSRYEQDHDIRMAVVDPTGTVRFSSPRWTDTGTPEVRRAIDTALAGRQTCSPGGLLPWQDTPAVVAAPVTDHEKTVAALVSVSSSEGARNLLLRDWTLLALAGILGLLGAVFTAGRLTRWVLGGVEDLDAATQRIAGGDFSARTRTDCGPVELRRFAGSFNHMADQVQQADRTQRAFVADAGHQLRNPLGALLVRLEGLALTCSPADRDAVLRAARDGRHLAETLDRMLELARAEHTGAVAGPVDVAAVVDDRLAGWGVVAERRGIELRRRGLGSAVAWHEANAVAGAFDAVIDNAVKYSPAESCVTIDVRTSGADGRVDGADGRAGGADGRAGSADGRGGSGLVGRGPWIEIRVSDEGPGLEPDELHRVTDRFWRSPRAGGTSGSGLGMGIAATLLERHAGRLEVTAPGTGLCVILHMPCDPPNATPNERAADGVQPRTPSGAVG